MKRLSAVVARALGLPPVTGTVCQEPLDEAAVEASEIRRRLDQVAAQHPHPAEEASR